MSHVSELLWFLGGVVAGIYVAAVVGIAWDRSFGADE